MKKVILLALLMPFPAFGQIIENFESQSVANWIQSTEGHWSADTASSLSGRFSLHHIFDNPDTGNDRIGIRTDRLHPAESSSSWSFLIRYGYDPSSTNNWAVFLMSDTDPASMGIPGSTKGFAIGVNFTGSDDSLRLWKMSGNVITQVVNCRINWQTDIGMFDAAKIIVDRNFDGKWVVTVNKPDGTLINKAYGDDKELFNPNWFGVLYKYSSTKDRLLWLDDITINGSFHSDTEAPTVVSCQVTDKNTADLILNEEPAPGSMVPANFSLNAIDNKVISVINKDDLEYQIVFSEDFQNRRAYSLTINELCDLSGNCSHNVIVNFTPAGAEAGDVVISEIMADPVPSVSLPECEYVEITNTTPYSFNLKGWKLYAGTQEYSFPETTIEANGIAVLCSKNDTSVFTKFGKVIGFSTFPSLTDAGRILYISDISGKLIHGVEYSGKWYRDDLKSGGGWSLEMIDSKNPFFYEGNWKASRSKQGGTPGKINSVTQTNPDLSFKGIENVFPVDSVTLKLSFSEPVLNFTERREALSIGDKFVAEVVLSDPISRSFTLKLEKPLEKKRIYDLQIPADLSDFEGNAADIKKFSFGLTEPAEPGDVLFNEILFNPLPGDPDYIELYNNSEKFVDISRLEIVTILDASADTSLPDYLWDEGRCMLPGEYFAISTDRSRVLQRYFSSDSLHIFERESLPSMSDDKGHLILYSRELEKIDELIYSDEMQYSLLSDAEGVALEKINPGKQSGEICAWYSASESSGWGTPGAPNSVFVEAPSEKDEVVLSSTKISPDNDGYEDFLTVTVNPKGSGNVVSITVFDETGGFVRKLAENLFAGAGASVVWDGTDDDGSMVNTGIYIVFISIYDDTGKTGKWKKVCTVIR